MAWYVYVKTCSSNEWSYYDDYSTKDTAIKTSNSLISSRGIVAVSVSEFENFNEAISWSIKKKAEEAEESRS